MRSLVRGNRCLGAFAYFRLSRHHRCPVAAPRDQLSNEQWDGRLDRVGVCIPDRNWCGSINRRHGSFRTLSHPLGLVPAGVSCACPKLLRPRRLCDGGFGAGACCRFAFGDPRLVFPDGSRSGARSDDRSGWSRNYYCEPSGNHRRLFANSTGNTARLAAAYENRSNLAG